MKVGLIKFSSYQKINLSKVDHQMYYLMKPISWFNNCHILICIERLFNKNQSPVRSSS